MTDEFAWHAAALKGTRGPISADDPMSGFYRQKRQDGSYEPVAYWKDSRTGEQRCHINGKSPHDPIRALEIWPFASRYPISSEAYWHRMDTGQWLDNDPAAAAAARGPEIDPATDPAGSLRAEIAAARTGLDAYKTIESDEAAARAQSLRSTLTGLKGKAEHAYEAENRPLLDRQTAIRKIWFPLRDDAEAGANAIRTAIGTWEDVKREAARQAAQKAAAEAAAHAEAARKAEEAGKPPPPAPAAPVASNLPPPATKIKGGSGRAASVGVKRVVTAIDLDKAWQQFAGLPEVYNLFMELAQNAVNAGIDTPCATVEEKSDIR